IVLSSTAFAKRISISGHPQRPPVSRDPSLVLDRHVPTGYVRPPAQNVALTDELHLPRGEVVERAGDLHSSGLLQLRDGGAVLPDALDRERGVPPAPGIHRVRAG